MVSSSARTLHAGRYLLVLVTTPLILLVLGWVLSHDEPVVIGGDVVERLAPGQMVPLDLTLTNPRGFPVSVSDLRVAVSRVNAPHADDQHPCTRDDFAVTQRDNLDIVLPGDAASTLTALAVPRSSWPQVGMRDRPLNQDGCKNAFLTLRFEATGTRDR